MVSTCFSKLATCSQLTNVRENYIPSISGEDLDCFDPIAFVKDCLNLGTTLRIKRPSMPKIDVGVVVKNARHTEPSKPDSQAAKRELFDASEIGTLSLDENRDT